MCDGDVQTNQYNIIAIDANTGEGEKHDINRLTWDICPENDCGGAITYQQFLAPFNEYFKEDFFPDGVQKASGSCWSSSQMRQADSGGDMGILFGGYLYVTQDNTEIYTSMQPRIQRKRNDGRVVGYAYLAVYDLQTDDDGKQISKIDFSKLQVFHSHIQRASYSGTAGEWYAPNPTYKKLTLNKGVYYVIGVMLNEGDENDVRDKMITVNIGPQKVVPGCRYETGGDSDDDTNCYLNRDQDEFFDTTSPFAIKSSFLSAGDVVSIFSTLVDFDTSKAFCEAGGFSYNPSSANPKLKCCGDDGDADVGFDDSSGYACKNEGGIFSIVPFVDDGKSDNGDDNYCEDYMDPAGGSLDFGSYSFDLSSPSAQDGSDGCCGDDPELVAGCERLNGCSAISLSYCYYYDNGCHIESTCIQQGDGFTKPTCTELYNDEEACRQNSPWCEWEPGDDQLPELQLAGVGGGVAQDPSEGNKVTGFVVQPGSGRCVRTDFECSDYSDTNACSNVIGCYFSVAPICVGDITTNCGSASSCTEKYGCQETGTTSSDLGYVTTENFDGKSYFRYLCNKDYNPDDLDSPVSYDPSYSRNEWRWWFAGDYDSRYRIHTTGTLDYLSNGENWFYCSDTDVGNSGTRVDYGIDNHPQEAGGDATSYCPKVPDTLTKQVRNPDWPNYALDSQCTADYSDMQLENYIKTVLGYTPSVEEMNSIKDGFRVTPGLESSQIRCCKNAKYTGPPTRDYKTYLTFQYSADDECRVECFPVPEGGGGNPPNDDGNYVDIDDIVINNGDYYLSQNGATCKQLAQSGGISYDLCDGGYNFCQQVVGGLGIWADNAIDDPTTTDYVEGRCCLGGVCRRSQDLTCEQLDGYTLADDSCPPDEIIEDVDTTTTCCRVYTGPEEDEPDYGPTVPRNEAFICYEDPNGQPLFAECCSKKGCSNADAWSVSSMIDSGRIFARGSQLNTIISFDTAGYDGAQGLMINRAYKWENTINPTPLPTRSISFAVNVYKDWNDYDSLSFDIIYEGPIKPTTVELLDSDGAVVADPFNLNQHSLIPSFPSGVWNHISIPLTKDYPNVASVRLNAIEYFGAGARTDYLNKKGVIHIDKFVLHESDDSTNYYCGGETQKWISTLNPRSTTDPDPEQYYLPYRLACDAQLSYAWTGTKCCGADSTRPRNTNTNGDDLLPNNEEYYNYGQYYTDTEKGCWGGVAVKEGFRVSDVYGGDLNTWGHLLYKDDEFWSCEKDQHHPSRVTVTKVDPFTIKGDWVCSGQQWVRLSTIKPAAILVSKLYGIAVDEDKDYVLHCDDYKVVVQEVISSNALNNISTLPSPPQAGEGDPQTACVLKLLGDDGATTSTFIGFPLSAGEEGLAAFMDGIYDFEPMLSAGFDPLDIPDCTRTKSGSPMPKDITNAENYFSECYNSGAKGGLNAYYNKPFNILIISYEGETDEGFLNSLWSAVTGFFRWLFGGQEGTPNQGLALSNAEMGAIPLEANDYTHSYMARSGSAAIYGVKESDLLGDWHVRVDYRNLAASVEPLKNAYVQAGLEDGVDARYCAEWDFPENSDRNFTQTIYLTFGKNDDVDWRFLTSNLRLQSAQWAVFDIKTPCEPSPPPIGDVSDQYLVFITTNTYKGFEGSNADHICTQDAEAASSLTGHIGQGAFVVLATSKQSHLDKFEKILGKELCGLRSDGTVYCHDGLFVRDLFVRGTGVMQEDYLRKLNGEIPNGESVWTGIDSNGQPFDTTSSSHLCNDWTTPTSAESVTMKGAVGNPRLANGGWLHNNVTVACSTSNSIYFYCLVPYKS